MFPSMSGRLERPSGESDFKWAEKVGVMSVAFKQGDTLSFVQSALVCAVATMDGRELQHEWTWTPGTTKWRVLVQMNFNPSTVSVVE